MKRFGLVGEKTRCFLTYNGRILIHDNRAELEFLFPFGATVREVPSATPAGQCFPIRLHPDLVTVGWPLNRNQFIAR